MPSTSSSTGSKSKLVKGNLNIIRIVDSGTDAWARKTGFTGEHIEVTPKIPELVDLVLAIDTDPSAKAALSRFLQVLERADVVKMLSNV